MMDFQQVSALCGMSAAQAARLAPGWERSEARLPAARPAFLRAEQLREIASLIDGLQELGEALCRVADRVAETPELLHLAWHMHYRTYVGPEIYPGPALPALDLPEALLGEDSGLFNLLIPLSAVPLVFLAFERHGLPREAAVRQIQWIGPNLGYYRASHGGRPGFILSSAGWLRHSVEGRVWRVNRFEFLMGPYPAWAPAVYVHNLTGRIAVLAPNGWKFDAAWNRLPDTARSADFTTVLTDDHGVLRGLRLRHDGRVLGPAELPLTDWHPIAAQWDLCPTIHIPGGGAMTPEAVRGSLLEAPEFFRRLFHRTVPVLFCRSWILNPEWRRLLPDSNLARFQEAVFQVPAPVDGGKDGLFFVFGRDDGDPLADYPADTSLRRAILQSLRDGHPLKCGIAVIPTHRLAQLGHPEEF